MVIVDAENVKILKGENFLKEYVFHTKVAKHYFCSKCGSTLTIIKEEILRNAV